MVSYIVIESVMLVGTQILARYLYELFVNHRTKRIRIEHKEEMTVGIEEIKRVLTQTLEIDE